MRNSLILCGLFACALSLGGCDDDCRVGVSECVSTSLIRTCAPTGDGAEWLVLQCGPNEQCQSHAEMAGDAGETKGDGGAETGDATGAACVGTCKIGEHSCVGPTLARICINGGVWQLDPCDVGESCDSSVGACVVGGDAAVRRCNPGAKACASEKVEKVCDADGTAWVEQPCAANESCLKDECTADPKSSCDDANACIDNKTAVRCLGTDKGFELVNCAEGLYCEAGRCRGAVCAIGSLCSANNQVRECVDGKSIKDIQCGVNEVCQQNKDRASCVPLQCTTGTSACGDPRDPSVDAKKHFTTCSVAAGGSGVPEWVKGECTGNTTCNPALVNTANPCSQTCTKGAQRCAADAVTGVNDGYQECGDDGKWGSTRTCNTGNVSQLQCVIAPNPNASELPKAVCAEPVCWWAFTNPSALATGACDGEKLLKCKPDGKLADAATCPQGVCRNVNMVINADGRTPAACDTTPQCEEGEEQCLTAGSDATPRYRTCVNGFFSSALETCAGDGACFNTRNEQGKRRKLCGVECAPGSGRCNGEGELEECKPDGTWATGKQCSKGECRSLSNNDAACVMQCVPGTRACVGSSAVADDGFHTGTTQERSCGNDGLWNDASDCTGGRVCRVSASGVGLGCVACVGPKAPGGNKDGLIDTRCDPDDDKKIQDCGDNNSWLSARTCDDGRTCVAPVAQTCGTCTGAAGGTFTCTDSNLRTEQICASCAVPLTAGGPTTIPVCTQTAVAAVANTATTTCGGVPSGGTASSWAGHPDCCSGYQRTAMQTYNASCLSLSYGAPGAWGNVPDCCASYQLGSTGAGFAYCE
ncbi:MAG TPA: hypothetical protein VJV78_29515 [Polyangiales bacterium]|nr:hypothetical protein [Polyangiales bacterium]